MDEPYLRKALAITVEMAEQINRAKNAEEHNLRLLHIEKSLSAKKGNL